jgi:hypothetical protein
VSNLIDVEVSASLPTPPIGFKESHYKNGLNSETNKIMTKTKAAESYDFAWVREPWKKNLIFICIWENTFLSTFILILKETMEWVKDKTFLPDWKRVRF